MTRAHSFWRALQNWSLCALMLTSASVMSAPSVWAADTAEPTEAAALSTTPLKLLSFTQFDASAALTEDLRTALLALAAKEASGDFKESRTLPGFPKPMVSQGVFLLQGDKLVWDTQTPFPSVLHVSPTGIVIEADGERQELSAAEIPAVGRAAEMLSAILSGRLSVLEDLFEVRAIREADRIQLAARPKPNANTQLACVAKELRASALLGENAHVDTLELEAADGTLTRIDLERVRVTR